MAYKDKAKQKAYQAEWVRQKRASKGSTDKQGSTEVNLRPLALAESQTSESVTQIEKVLATPIEGLNNKYLDSYMPTIEQQSHSPMMVGYVVPEE